MNKSDIGIISQWIDSELSESLGVLDVLQEMFTSFRV